MKKGLSLLVLALALFVTTPAWCASLQTEDSAIQRLPSRWSEPARPALSTASVPRSTALPMGAVTVADASVEVLDNLDDYDDTPVSSIADPLEPWNRFWFRFNDIFYIHIVQPVYNGWVYITPDALRAGLSNLLHNSLFPTRFANNLLQGRFMGAGVEFSRFMMNMMGSAGLADLAKNKKTIVPVDPSGEDFGQTLGRWGVGQGFYLVWPVLGPSSLRDTVGMVGDSFTNPASYIQPWAASLGTKAGLNFNDAGAILPSYTSLTSISVDPYIAMREAYASMRQAQVLR